MAMTEFAVASDGVKLAYERLRARKANTAPPVVLVHGFGSSRTQNWKSTGWYETLTEAGLSLVAMDCRGHGDSDKPHDEASYGHARMAEDVAMVMDAAGLTTASLLGYSMGGFIALRLAAASPERLSRLVLGGVGEFYLRGPRIANEDSRARLSEALLTEDKHSITDKRGRMFRDFADQPGKDRFALAACMRAMSPPLPMDVLAQIGQPVLVVCGEVDEIAGPPGPLAAAFPQGRAVTIPGRDHMSAVGDRKTRQAVVDFLLAAPGP
jgi:pimeloyl-ACP methyl ester carboxylesterase